MTQSTITLPDDLSQTVDDLAQKDGMSREEFIGEAIKHEVFLRQFRTLRERLAAKAQQQGILTDQDVFDRVS